MTPQEQFMVRQEIEAAIHGLNQQWQNRFNQYAASQRHSSDQVQHQFNEQLHNLATIASSLEVSRSYGEQDTGVVRIEDIPGRRIPFDYCVDIDIGADETSEQSGTITISQEGPFYAVARYATFQSAHQYQIDQTTFQGRSFGRYRPIHSAWDLLDGKSPSNVVMTPNPLVLGSTVAATEIPGAMSDFRTMEFDGRITVVNQGSSFPRQNISVPSPFWSTAINSPQQLGCLDFFERGEVIQFRVQPTHVNNPPFGNVNGVDIFGAGNGWPFVEGQYDRQEGILTPSAFAVAESPTSLETDPVTRLPNGILTIGFLGVRVQQPIGPTG